MLRSTCLGRKKQTQNTKSLDGLVTCSSSCSSVFVPQPKELDAQASSFRWLRAGQGLCWASCFLAAHRTLLFTGVFHEAVTLGGSEKGNSGDPCNSVEPNTDQDTFFNELLALEAARPLLHVLQMLDRCLPRTGILTLYT